jgi:hypothetical protein
MADIMPCLIPLIAFFFPRLVMVIILIFTHWFRDAFDSALWPILGFFFMPYLTLAYMAAMLNNNHTVSGGWLALVIIAAFFDAGAIGTARRRRSRRAGK